MFEKTKEWLRKHKKGVVITAVLSAVAGTVIVLLNNGQKVEVPVEQFTKSFVPEVPKPSHDVVKAVEETVAFKIEGVAKTFPRSEFIRHLPEGQNPSLMKLAQAAEMGIDLNPGETIVNSCMVTRHVA